MKPFLHVSLILVFGGLVLEYVKYFVDLLVIGCGYWGVLLRGAAGDAEGVPVEAMFIRDGCQ